MALKRASWTFFVFSLIFVLSFEQVKADLSCSFYGDTIQVPLGYEIEIDLDVTNTGSSDVYYLKFVTEGEYFKVLDGSASGWQVNLTGNDTIFSGNKLYGSQSGRFVLKIQGLSESLEDLSGLNAFISENGVDFFECSGGRSVQVVLIGQPNLTPTPIPTYLPDYSASSQDRSLQNSSSPNLVSVSSSLPDDHQPPLVSLTTNFSNPFKTSPSIKGKVLDNGEASFGIKGAFYSLDGGKNWFPINNFKCQSLRDCYFSFVPEIYEDGDYRVQVKAVDISGNTGYSPFYTLVIDRLPPQIGPVFLTVGNLIVNPDGNVFKVISGLKYKAVFKTVGGTTFVEFLAGDKTFKGLKNEEGNFWEVFLEFDKSGDYPFKAVSFDGAGNKTEKDLGMIAVRKKGKIRGNGELIDKGEIRVYVYSPLVSRFVLWNGIDFYQDNPIRFKDGEYSLLLPPGKYYLEVYSSGFRTWQSNIFELSRYSILNEDINLEKREGFRLGFINFSLDFTVTRGKIYLLQDKDVDHPLEGKEMPDIGLILKERLARDFDISGKKFLLSFLSTYHPQASIQLNLLNQSDDDYLWVIVFPQEQDYFIRVYKKRGLYKHNFVADQDGALFARFAVLTTPLHFLIDERGVIIDVEEGLIDNNYLKDVFNLID